jgi:tRNA uridine 5-carboxymethylaminomethyl modification enzyme
MANAESIACSSVVVTTGTFLKGVCHIGKKKFPAGRFIRNSDKLESPSIGLADTLKRFQFNIGRLTTGTPPRLHKDSINYKDLEYQCSDDLIKPFSFIHEFEGFKPRHQLLPCHITRTNEKTHSVIEANRKHLPEFQANEGRGVGPRYCPAIEKKVIRDKVK